MAFIGSPNDSFNCWCSLVECAFHGTEESQGRITPHSPKSTTSQEESIAIRNSIKQGSQSLPDCEMVWDHIGPPEKHPIGLYQRKLRNERYQLSA
ncbi:hypothetical protein KIN20_019450 [Parelaphostrongylus tenuis]|uniref:Uncharacterized protein n=1 Tax=Parelaphostrongylus tenuis TaxID=148309 RepID=A0AAD5N5J5_PARTN|nr:hypothetical protein KIN20_019450 [Parelaphostrongylus tenuis]